MITALPPGMDRIEETTVRYVFHERPVTFDEFLDLFLGTKDSVELVNGTIVEKPMVGWEHEHLQNWLLRLAGDYIETHDLGVSAGSRSAVKISPLGSRLPDFFFVRKDRRDIIQEKAIMGPPDLVIEIRSPSNTKSEVIELESDYLSIRVPEVVFIDPRRRRVRVRRLRGDDYSIEEQTDGVLTLESIPGFWLDLAWLFDSPRPTVREAVATIEQGLPGA